MTEVADPAQTAKPLTFEPLSYLANDSTKTDSGNLFVFIINVCIVHFF